MRVPHPLLEARDWLRGIVRLTQATVENLRRRILGTVGRSECAPHPVIILPGVLEPWRFMTPLGNWLAERGHPVHYVTKLGFNLKPLAESAAHVLELLEAHGLHGAVLVAHSKGGLIGKTVLASPDVGDKVAGMVSVATPYHGSDLGGRLQRLPLVAKGPFGMFIVGSQALMTLSQQERVNGKIVSLIPAWDQAVNDGSAHLEGATNVTLEHGGHFRSLNQVDVWEQIHHWIHRLADEPGSSAVDLH